MKKIILLAILGLALSACGHKTNSSDTEVTALADSLKQVVDAEMAKQSLKAEDCTALIREFFTEAYVKNDDFRSAEQFMGAALVAKLNEKNGKDFVIDYDPFIRSKYFRKKTMPKTLQVKELSTGSFQVDIEPLADYKVSIQLTIDRDANDDLKIMDIPSDPNISVLK